MAASNPCPCGWRGSARRDCRCDDAAVSRYTARISGPLLDRIDLHVDVQPVAWSDLDTTVPTLSSPATRGRVARAQEVQLSRGGITNARIADREFDDRVAATHEARALLGRAVERFGLSARAARRTLRVARTIADLAGTRRTGPDAVAEALGFRADASAGY